MVEWKTVLTLYEIGRLLHQCCFKPTKWSSNYGSIYKGIK